MAKLTRTSQCLGALVSKMDDGHWAAAVCKTCLAEGAASFQSACKHELDAGIKSLIEASKHADETLKVGAEKQDWEMGMDDKCVDWPTLSKLAKNTIMTIDNEQLKCVTTELEQASVNHTLRKLPSKNILQGKKHSLSLETNGS